jgi:hypothetical protein
LLLVLQLQELDRESPDETQLLDAIDAASTWRQVRDAVWAAPSGALSVRAARDAVSKTSRLLRQHSCAGEPLQQGEPSATEGATGAAEDHDGCSAGSRTPEEQQWLHELAAMWSEEGVGKLRETQAAEVLSSMLLTELDIHAEVVQRLLHCFVEGLEGLRPEVSVGLLWAACLAGVVLPDDAVAAMLQHVEADFQQLNVWQLLCLTRCLQTLPAQQVPDALHDALVARCLHLRLHAMSDDTRNPRLALVEAVRQLSPEASEKLVRVALPLAAPTKLAQQGPQTVQREKVSGGCCDRCTSVTIFCMGRAGDGLLAVM